MTSSMLESRASGEQIRLRTARLGLLASGVGLAFYGARLVSLLTSANAPGLGSFSMVANLVGALSTLALYAVCRAPRSLAVVRASELVVLSVASACYAALVVGTPQVFRADAQMVFGLGVLLLGRAVYVPSSRRRTALLGALMGVPIIAAVYATHQEIEPGFRAAYALAGSEASGAPLRGADGEGGPAEFTSAGGGGAQPPPTAGNETPSDGNLRWNIVGSQAVNWVATVFIASWVSGVIYGLRREVREARRFGQYQLEAKLGEGGMGVVYRAHHALLRRATAIKLIRPDRVGEESLARLAREVRATAGLTHPNTVTIYDYGRSEDGVFYYAMELLDGATLTEVVAIDGPQPASRVAHVLHQVAGALAEAHEQKLIHRDIKPDNIVLTRIGGRDDFAKVVDFGLVKDVDPGAVDETGTDRVVGTPLYLAPETIRGALDPAGRGDLYALGAVAYFLLTAEHVFPGRTILDVCGMHLERTPEPPSARLGRAIPADLEAIVLRCLAKDPADRPSSARVLARELEACEAFGDWTEERARRWWQDFGPELEEQRSRAVSEVPSTGLTVDVLGGTR